MKFFSPKLLVEMNSKNIDIADRAEHAWRRCLSKYQRYLKQHEETLPRELLNLDLHDSILVSLDIQKNISIHLKLISQGYNVSILYSEIHEFSINNLNANMHQDGRLCLIDIYVDELHVIDEHVFCHEILFDSGYSLRLICKRVFVNKERIAQ